MSSAKWPLSERGRIINLRFRNLFLYGQIPFYLSGIAFFYFKYVNVDLSCNLYNSNFSLVWPYNHIYKAQLSTSTYELREKCAFITSLSFSSLQIITFLIGILIFNFVKFKNDTDPPLQLLIIMAFCFVGSVGYIWLGFSETPTLFGIYIQRNMTANITQLLIAMFAQFICLALSLDLLIMVIASRISNARKFR
jgi:hypothetical protein